MRYELLNLGLILQITLVLSVPMYLYFSPFRQVFYYSSQIFAAAGLNDEAIQYANLGAGFIIFSMTAASAWFVQTFRRRTLLITSCSLSIVNMVLLTLFSKFLVSGNRALVRITKA
jgi:hypothetical protein